MMEALGAITGLIGAGLQAQNQAQANIINMMALQFQKRNAADQMKFAQAGRQDQYGNESTFSKALNKWLMELTPTQKQITKAGEKEQLLSLTEDATRNRNIKREQRKRGIDAAKDYVKVLADYRYGQPRSELSIRDELTNLMAGVVNENSGKNKTELIRAALREGRGGDMSTILKAVNDDAGSNMAKTILDARTQAASEYSDRYGQYLQRTLPVMQQLRQIMDAGSSGPVNIPNDAAGLTGMQAGQAKAIQAALQNEAKNVGGAYKNLASTMGKSPNLGSLGKGLGGGGDSKKSSGSPYYSLMDPQDGNDVDTNRFTGDEGSF